MLFDRYDPESGKVYDGTTSVSPYRVYYSPVGATSDSFVRGRDYDVVAEYTSPDAGTHTYTIKFEQKNTEIGKNYQPTYKSSVLDAYEEGAIKPRPLDKKMFEQIAPQAHTGSAVRPVVEVADELEPGVVVLPTANDFTVAYESNTEAGTGVAVVTGRNNFTGQVRLEFEITDAVAPAPTLTPVVNGLVTPNVTYGDVMTVELEGAPEGTTCAALVATSSKGKQFELGTVAVSGGSASLSYTDELYVNLRQGHLVPKITLVPKDYDGRTATAVESSEWEGLAEGDELVQGVDYKIVASDFKTADAGKNKPATVEIQLLTDSGTEAMRLYRLEDAQYPDGTTTQETFEVAGTVNPAELTPEMFEKIGPQECTGQKLEPPVKTTGTDGSFSIAYETSRKGLEPGTRELEVRAGEKSVG